MADFGSAGDVLEYLFGFWVFVFNRTYRERVMTRWRAAQWPDRGFMLVDATIATLAGVGVPVFVVVLIVVNR